MSTGEGRRLGRLLVLFVPGVLLAAWARLPLTWDGSYFLVDLLDHGRPVVLHGRVGMTVFQVPASLAASRVSDTTALAVLFSVPYVVVPLVALALSHRVVRATRPELVVWAALGIGVVTLPGQVFFVSESQMVGELVWPLLLSTLVGYRWNRVWLVVLVVFLVLLHPMAAPALGVVAVVAELTGRRRPDERALLRGYAWLFGGAAVLRQAMTSAGLDAETPKLGDYGHQWSWAVNGAPLVMVVGATLAAVLLGVALVRSRRPASEGEAPSPGVLRALVGGGLNALALAVIAAVRWGSDPHLWRSALDYRSFVVVLALPVMAVALVEAWGPAVTTPGAQRVRRVVVVLCGVAFSATLGAQSLGWNGLMDYAREDLARQTQPCVVRHVAEKDGTAMRHWANPSLALLVQGRAPKVVVVGERSACAHLAATGELLLPRTGKERNTFSHWFHLDEVRRALTGQS